MHDDVTACLLGSGWPRPADVSELASWQACMHEAESPQLLVLVKVPVPVLHPARAAPIDLVT
jgi:hypothetical protein